MITCFCFSDCTEFISDDTDSRVSIFYISGQMAERLGNQATYQKVASLIPGRANDVVFLGKALHPTCLGGMSLYLL